MKNKIKTIFKEEWSLFKISIKNSFYDLSSTHAVKKHLYNCLEAVGAFILSVLLVLFCSFLLCLRFLFVKRKEKIQC